MSTTNKRFKKTMLRLAIEDPPAHDAILAKIRQLRYENMKHRFKAAGQTMTSKADLENQEKVTQ